MYGGKTEKDAACKVDLIMSKYKIGKIKSCLEALDQQNCSSAQNSPTATYQGRWELTFTPFARECTHCS